MFDLQMWVLSNPMFLFSRKRQYINTFLKAKNHYTQQEFLALNTYWSFLFKTIRCWNILFYIEIFKKLAKKIFHLTFSTIWILQKDRGTFSSGQNEFSNEFSFLVDKMSLVKSRTIFCYLIACLRELKSTYIFTVYCLYRAFYI